MAAVVSVSKSSHVLDIDDAVGTSLRDELKDEILASCDRAVKAHREELKGDASLKAWAGRMPSAYVMEWFSERNMRNIPHSDGPHHGGCCEHCSKDLFGHGQLHHHPEARRDGGKSVPENLVMLCNDCHTLIEDSRQPKAANETVSFST